MTPPGNLAATKPVNTVTATVVVSAAVAYGHIVSGIYLIAFWRRFGLQPFQHGGVAELIPAGIAAVGVLIVLVFLGAAVGQIIGGTLAAPAVPQYVGGSVVGLLIVGFVAFFIWGPASRWWLALGLFLQVVLSLCFMRFRLLPERLRTYGVASGIAVVAGYAPATAAFIANQDADKAIAAHRGQVVSEETTGLPPTRDRLLKYVGRLGESTVFYAPCSGKTWLVRAHPNQLVVHRRASAKGQGLCNPSKASSLQLKVCKPPRGQ